MIRVPFSKIRLNSSRLRILFSFPSEKTFIEMSIAVSLIFQESLRGLCGESFPSFCSSSRDDCSSGLGAHSLTETVLVLSLSVMRLIRPFQFILSSFKSYGCREKHRHILKIPNRKVKELFSPDPPSKCILPCCPHSQPSLPPRQLKARTTGLSEFHSFGVIH